MTRLFEQRHLYQQFSEKETAAGAEHVLSENMTFSAEKPGYYERRRYGILEADSVRKLIGHVPKSPGTFPFDVWVTLDETNGEILETSCPCNSWRANQFSCEHVAAVLVHALTERDGVESLKDTHLEKLLIKHTGMREPLLPGALKHTDDDLLQLWESSVRNLDWSSTDQGKGMLSAEFALRPADGGVLIEAKVGTKKRYVVKNLRTLLWACGCHGKYTLGKEEHVMGLEYFEEPGRRIMTFLLELYQQSQDTSYGRILFRSVSGGEDRYLYLDGRNLDACMERMAGSTVRVSGNVMNNQLCVIDKEPPKLGIQMEKYAYGATIRAKQMELLAQGARYLYVACDDRLSMIEISGSTMLKNFLTLLAQKKELYIRDDKLPVICRDMLPQLQEKTPVQTIGMDLQTYIPEKPVLELYLDLPQSDMISCMAYARYDKAGKKYLLFQEQDQGQDVAREREADQEIDRETEQGKKQGAALRNVREEQLMKHQVAAFFDAYDENTGAWVLTGDDGRLYQFLVEGIEQLSMIAEVLVSDTMNQLKVRHMPIVDIGIRLESGLLHMSVSSDDMSKEELVEVLSAYRRKKNYHRLRNGSFIRFDEKEQQLWETLSETFRQYGKMNPEDMTMPLFRSLYLDEMLREKDAVNLKENRSYKELLLNMDFASEAEYAVPDSLADRLRGYQADGFRWMKTLKQCGFCGILADDMGLGKTLQVLTFLLSEKEDGATGKDMRTLIVAPASLLYNWKKELETFTPQLNCRVIGGDAASRKELIAAIKGERSGQREDAERAEASRQSRMEQELEKSEESEQMEQAESSVRSGQNEMIEQAQNVDVWITSYDLLKRDIAFYEGCTFANLIIDEAQYIKNHGTQASKAVRLIESSFRMALTGTPIENRLSELWSIFDFLMPGFLYGYKYFRDVYEAPVVNSQDADVTEKLRHLIHPFILRRLKKDVLKDLPDKLEEVVTVRLEGEQRKLYDAYAQRLRMFLAKQSPEEFSQNKLEILKELTRLRQLCCGPGLFLEGYRGGNAKLDTLMELVQQGVDGGHKILIFSQFTTVLDEIERALKKEKLESYRIDGSVKKEERMRRVEAFAHDQVPVFCISLKAGGTGLNLTAADIVIHYDPWWNAAAQNQATDRAHRIGQEHVVTVYRMIAENTIEEQILKLQQSKSDLVEEVLSGDRIGSILIDKEEILALL